MKILLLSWRCIRNPQAGGSELYFHELAKRWVQKGHEVVWFSPAFKGSHPREVVDGVNIIRRGNRLSVYFFAWHYYVTGQLGKGFDVILDIENGYPFFTPFYAPSVPTVLHIHHLHTEQWFTEFRFPLSQIGHFLESHLMPFAYGKRPIITLCESSAKEIKKHLFPRSQPIIVNPGIEFYKKQIIPKNKKPAVLFLNRIKKYKGVETLVRAAEILQKKDATIQIWIAGSGDDLPRMKSLAEELNLKNITFLGRVSEEEKRRMMQRAWAFVNPSFKEGWGIVNIEANYAGTPAIGADVGGTRDSIIEGKTGLLFPVDNARELASRIYSLVHTPSLRKKLEAGALKWSHLFDWNSKADAYLAILKKAAQKNLNSVKRR